MPRLAWCKAGLVDWKRPAISLGSSPALHRGSTKRADDDSHDQGRGDCTKGLHQRLEQLERVLARAIHRQPAGTPGLLARMARAVAELDDELGDTAAGPIHQSLQSLHRKVGLIMTNLDALTAAVEDERAADHARALEAIR